MNERLGLVRRSLTKAVTRVFVPLDSLKLTLTTALTQMNVKLVRCVVISRFVLTQEVAIHAFVSMDMKNQESTVVTAKVSPLARAAWTLTSAQVNKATTALRMRIVSILREATNVTRNLDFINSMTKKLLILTSHGFNSLFNGYDF